MRYLRQTIPKNHLVATPQETRVREGGEVRVHDVSYEVQAQAQSAEALQRSHVRLEEHVWIQRGQPCLTGEMADIDNRDVIAETFSSSSYRSSSHKVIYTLLILKEKYFLLISVANIYMYIYIYHMISD